MFEDEAGFGRINKPKRCWCPKGQRPSVPCHHIREYRYAFGAVEPLSGESFFLTMPNCDTECTNIFLEKLPEQYPDDITNGKVPFPSKAALEDFTPHFRSFGKNTLRLGCQGSIRVPG